MKLDIKGYHIEICYDARPKFPRYLKNHVLLAVEDTLHSLPVKLLKKHLSKGESYLLNLSVVSEKQIKELNSKYRSKHKVTDVLSFSRLEGKKLISVMPDIGDVILCFEVAKNQAKIWQNTVPEEIRRLTVHGILHVFGYDHERSKKDEKIMFSLQEAILKEMKRKYYSRIASIGSKREALTAGSSVARKIKRDATK